MGNINPVSPLRGWLGGKYRLAGTIIPLIPSDHTCYAEVFGGAAWVLFKKPPSKVEAINDINAMSSIYIGVFKTTCPSCCGRPNTCCPAAMSIADCSIAIPPP